MHHMLTQFYVPSIKGGDSWDNQTDILSRMSLGDVSSAIHVALNLHSNPTSFKRSSPMHKWFLKLEASYLLYSLTLMNCENFFMH